MPKSTSVMVIAITNSRSVNPSALDWFRFLLYMKSGPFRVRWFRTRPYFLKYRPSAGVERLEIIVAGVLAHLLLAAAGLTCTVITFDRALPPIVVTIVYGCPALVKDAVDVP